MLPSFPYQGTILRMSHLCCGLITVQTSWCKPHILHCLLSCLLLVVSLIISTGHSGIPSSVNITFPLQKSTVISTQGRSLVKIKLSVLVHFKSQSAKLVPIANNKLVHPYWWFMSMWIRGSSRQLIYELTQCEDLYPQEHE